MSSRWVFSALFALVLLALPLVVGSTDAWITVPLTSPVRPSSFTPQVSTGPTLALAAPQSGDAWPMGTAQRIIWSSLDFTGDVRIDLSSDSFMTITLTISAATPNSGSFCWRLINVGLQTGNYQVRVSPVAQGGPTPAISGTFSITGPFQSLAVSAPVANEIWTVGSDRIITWTSSNLVGNIRIELLRTIGANTEKILLFDDVPLSPPMKRWRVSGTVTTSAQIKVSSIVDPFVSAVSSTFTILVPGSTLFSIGKQSRPDSNGSFCGSCADDGKALRLDAPGPGERWQAGDTRRIYWTSSQLPPTGKVRLELSTDGGTTFPIVIADEIDNNLSFPWTVPVQAISNRCRVRISSKDLPDIQNVTEGDFSIIPQGLGSLRLLVPDGGEIYPPGSTQRLRWASSGNAGRTVQIDFSSDGGKTFQTLLRGIPNNTDRIWTVPMTKSERCRVRIVSEQRDLGPLISDISNCDFKVQ